jgi:hypothetical protein
MAIPFRPVGVGAVAAFHVFRINFSQALSQIPELHAWDDFNLNTVTGKIFTGTTVNGNKPMLGAIGANVAPSAAWWPASAVSGAAVNVASRLIGTDGWCKLSASAPGAGDSVYFNMDFKFPSDVSPSDTISACLSVLYRYTGSVPSVTWSGNDAGTEGSPIWTALTTQPKGTNGAATVIRPSDAGGDGTGDVVTIPGSSEAFPAEIWVTTAA